MAKEMHFKSKKAYHDWLAYGHLHVPDFGEAPYPKIEIAGHPHRVKHGR